MTEDPKLFYFRSEDVKVPTTMTAAAAALIDRLEIRQQLVLKVAAAFEDDMSFEDLADLCIRSETMGNLNREQTQAMLKSEVPFLVREELLTVTEAGDLRFAQKHLQEAAYSLLTFKLRQKLHQELAQLLAGRTSRRKLARHYCKSESWLEALMLLEQSSEDALRMHGYDEASAGFIELLHLVATNSQAAALAPSVRIGHWHIGLAIAQQRLGNMGPSATHFSEAVRLLGGRKPVLVTSATWLLRRYALSSPAVPPNTLEYSRVEASVCDLGVLACFRPAVRVLLSERCDALQRVQGASQLHLDMAPAERG
jgi:hypothetical protein